MKLTAKPQKKSSENLRDMNKQAQRYARCWEHRQYLKANLNPKVYRRKEVL